MFRFAVTALALVAALQLGCRSSSPATTDGPVVNPHQDSGVPHDVAPGPEGGGSGYASVHAMLTDCWGGTTCSNVSINTAVVTAVKANGKGMWIQDMAGGPRSGIQIYCNPSSTSAPCSVSLTTIQAILPGNIVQVSGVWSPYYSANEMRPTSITVTDATATTMPAATPITAAQADLAATLVNWDYAGVYVTISTVPLHVTDPHPMAFANSVADGGNPCAYGSRWGAFEIGDGTSTIAIETTFYKNAAGSYLLDLDNDIVCASKMDGGALYDHLVQVGDTFSTMGGILDWDTFNKVVVLQPTGKSDYTYGATGDHDGG